MWILLFGCCVVVAAIILLIIFCRSSEGFESDSVWVINLTRRPDRWKLASQRLQNAGLTPKRWNAVDARDIEAPNNKLTVTQYACYLSHLTLWKHIYNSGVPYALIFEDDLKFAPGITRKDLEKELQIAKGFDMLFFGHCGAKQFSSPVVLPGYAACGHAYAISRKGIEKILNSPGHLSLPVDMIGYNMCKKVGNCYISHNVPITNQPKPSTPVYGIVHQDTTLGSDIN